MESWNDFQRPPKRWSPGALFFLACGLFVVLLVVTLAVAAIAFAGRGSARLAREIAKIREAGEPASAAELEAHYQLPRDVEDTTELWLEATRPLATEGFTSDAGELPIVGTGEGEIPPPGRPWPELEAAEQLLEKYRTSLELMHKAAGLGGAARYPTDFSLGFNMLLDHAQNLRGGARLLTLEAHVLAHRGDSAGAAQSIHTILMLARSLEREPVLVSELVRLACDGIAREQLQLLLPTVDFSGTDLTRLQEEFRAVDYHEGLYQALLGERVTAIVAFESPGSVGLEIDVGEARFWRFTQHGGFAFYLQHMDRLIAASKLPWPQALQAAEQADAQLENLKNASILTRVTHLFPSFVAPAVSAAFTATARNAAMNGAADAAVAVERYRREKGIRPERLEQLVPSFMPEVPTDPYDGRPLRYVVRENEYLIYSVGENRIDDGGNPSKGPDARELDLVFRVGSPAESENDPDDEETPETAN